MSTFFISAMTEDPLVFFDSQPDSGYSLDNLAPATPANATLHHDLTITWDEPEDLDFQYVTIYGSNTEVLDGTQVVIGYSDGTMFDVSYQLYSAFLLTATDHSGNESPASFLVNDFLSTSGRSPARTALKENYPNPFNPTTTISFELANSQPVFLNVYDVAGRIIRRLEKGSVLPAGRHESHWDGRDESGRKMPASLYFYHLEAGSFSQTKRMMLIK
jgi:hypothetical protein